MRNLFCFMSFLFLIPFVIKAQIPEGINYAATLRDTTGTVLADQSMSARISILSDTLPITETYVETHNIMTNMYGQMNVVLGAGVPETGDFSTINWLSSPYFIRIEIDTAGGTDYLDLGFTEIWSVPYAFYADSSRGLSSPLSKISDSDGDTYIDVESQEDDDMIRFYNGENGWERLRFDGDRLAFINGGWNTFIGRETGSLIDWGGENVFIGDSAGYSNSISSKNVIIGNKAGRNNVQTGNTYVGYSAGYSNTGAHGNVFVGSYAGFKNTAMECTFIGASAGYNNVQAGNTFVGYKAGYHNTSSHGNVFVGSYAGYENLSMECTFIGTEAGYKNMQIGNTFIGYQAGKENVNGWSNIFIGCKTGQYNVNGYSNTYIGEGIANDTNSVAENVFLGYQTAHQHTSGNCNVMIGNQSGFENENGENNVFLGYKAGYYETGSNKLYISNSDTDTPLLYGEFDTGVVTLNDVLKLTPRNSAPSGPEAGMIYFDSLSGKLMVYDGSEWQACW